MHPLTSLRLGALAAAMILPVHAADTVATPTVAAKVRSVGMEPTGKYDRLGAVKNGHGSGAFAPEIGVNVQQYFLLGHRLLRGRINVLHQFPLRTGIRGVQFGQAAMPDDVDDLIMHRTTLERMLDGTYWHDK